MPSPFPGMNPYLERDVVWHDFHQHFCVLCSELLVPQVRPRYFVKLEEHLYIHELSAEEGVFLGRADVSVTDRGEGVRPSAATAILEAPVYGQIPPSVDIEHESYLEIRDRESLELVTVIELLSPANKESDRKQYLAMREEYLSSNAHFVEIDLRRGGPRLPLKNLPACDYYALVSRAEDRSRVGIWPSRLRDRLPIIPIPLRAPDPDARIDLQAMIHRLYDAAGYEDYIYTGTPQPPLSPEDAAWAKELLPKTV